MCFKDLIFVLFASYFFVISCADEVCFDGLGCFPLGEPWSSFKRPVQPPRGPDIVRVDYQMFSRESPDELYIVTGLPTEHIPYSVFDGNKKTIFMTHGWKGSANDSWMNLSKDLYLKAIDANVILVDYGYASKANYLQAVSDARVVGAQMARFCQYLIDHKGTSADKFHFIGVSLGAHVVAYAAKRIPGVGRLTGLDPAQPLFEGESKEIQFDKGDALFVEVAHTNGRPSLPFLGLGINWPIGHVDFYFNGGWTQPGCNLEAIDTAVKSISQGNLNIWEAWPESLLCPHARAVYYYLESFGYPNCTYWGVKRNEVGAWLNILTRGWLGRVFNGLSSCNLDTCVPFGLKTIDYPARGSFDVVTSESSPFCINSQKVDASMEKQLLEHQQKRSR